MPARTGARWDLEGARRIDPHEPNAPSASSLVAAVLILTAALARIHHVLLEFPHTTGLLAASLGGTRVLNMG